ncbi:MAG: hypothetical protein ACRDYU_13565 [Actinomycetes bacterium]
MPLFRLRTHDGAEQTVQANRVVSDATATRFERPSAGAWAAVLEVPTDDVSAIARRITEFDGRWTWITERPQDVVR